MPILHRNLEGLKNCDPGRSDRFSFLNTNESKKVINSATSSMSKKKGGRPRVENKATIQKTIYLTEDEHKQLLEIQQEMDISMAKLLKKGIINFYNIK